VNEHAGRVALVTGGARGIGAAITDRLAAQGATIAILDVDADAGRTKAAELTAGGATASFWQADVSKRSDVENAVEGVERELGPIQILINNAGMIVFGSLLDCRDEDWERMLAVDLYGVFVCTQLVAGRMVANGVKGRIVHIGSTASLVPAPQQFAYCVAKAGVRMIGEFAAAELVEHGITSNVVAPMGAVTDLNRELLSDPAVMAALEAALPAGRLATPDEIAALAVWLCSDDAAYVSGGTILHDGAALTHAIWWR
jgi:NAD(P)-dependent dehydrogenase (short-subunit alcohol dehydrogenase family)